MSLHEVRIGKEPIEAVTFSQLSKKKQESAELAAQIEAWEANGGKIEVAQSNQISVTNFNDSTDYQAEKARENNRKKCVKASMKSKFNPTAFESVYRSDANNDKFVFIVGKYISKQYDNINQAVNGRDFYRAKLER